MLPHNVSPRYVTVIEERRNLLLSQLHSILPSGDASFVWEVGCGHGHFLNAYAAAHPSKLCIGVDIESNRIERAEKKRDRAGLKNLHFLRAEARLFLSTLPDQARASDVFILFPDPWPKARHHKHRLLGPDFLATLVRHTTPDARICFRTDHREYYDEAAAAVRASPGWHLTDEAWPFEYNTVFQSRAPDHSSFIARRNAPVH